MHLILIKIPFCHNTMVFYNLEMLRKYLER